MHRGGGGEECACGEEESGEGFFQIIDFGARQRKRAEVDADACGYDEAPVHDGGTKPETGDQEVGAKDGGDQCLGGSAMVAIKRMPEGFSGCGGMADIEEAVGQVNGPNSEAQSDAAGWIQRQRKAASQEILPDESDEWRIQTEKVQPQPEGPSGHLNYFPVLPESLKMLRDILFTTLASLRAVS